MWGRRFAGRAGEVACPQAYDQTQCALRRPPPQTRRLRRSGVADANTMLLLLASTIVAAADVDPRNGNLRVVFPLSKPGFVHGVPKFLDFRSFLAYRRLASKGDVFECSGSA